MQRLENSSIDNVMEKDLVVEKTRTLYECAENRLKTAEDFFTSLPDQEVKSSIRNDILKFSRFLTIKGISKWSDVTPLVAQSFIIINQNENAATFNVQNWIKSMNDFFKFLIRKEIIINNIFTNKEEILENDFNEKLSPPRTCLRCGRSIDSNKAKYCNDCSILVRREATLRWNKEHADKIKKSMRAWRKRNPEKVREYRAKYNKQWKQKNPEKIREYRRKYRLKKATKSAKKRMGKKK